MAGRIKITIDNAEYHVILQENSLAERIAAMCPFTLDCTRSGEHEYYAALPRKTDAAGCLATTAGRRNGLYYFEGWNALSLVFKDCDTALYQIYQVGNFEEDVSSILKMAGKSIRIQCEAERISHVPK